MTASVPYRRVNKLMDVSTSVVVVPGDTPVRVVMSPKTSQGCRPISVKIQPNELASSGKKPTVAAAHHHSLWPIGLRRHRNHRTPVATAIAATPVPIINRNPQ